MQALFVPKEVEEIHATIRRAGFEAYLVGGCVRDLLIGRVPKDWDITTNAKPEDIQKLFEETFYENDFGTVGVVTDSSDPTLKVVEVTPYREEGKYSNARHPDEVRWADSLASDLKRRDFTINALAYEPSTRELVDLHDGKSDLERRSIATVGDPHERFSEDALRMLRAVRLSAELSFSIAPDTLSGIAKNASLLATISKERMRDELLRILMSDSPMQAIFIAQKLGLLTHILPELEEGMGCAQNQAHSFDVFEHSLRSLQHAADKKWPLTIRLAALLHDIGKPASRRWSDEKKDWTFHGHEVIGARMVKKICADLRLPGDMSGTIAGLVRWHMFFSDPDKVTLSAVRRIITNVGVEHIKELLNLRICDRIGTGRPKEQPFRLRKYMSMVDEAMRDPVSVGMLKINGTRIMEITRESGGPKLGWTLHALLEEILDDPGKNEPEYLETRAAALMKLPEPELRTLGEAGKIRREKEDEEAVQALREKHHVF